MVHVRACMAAGACNALYHNTNHNAVSARIPYNTFQSISSFNFLTYCLRISFRPFFGK